MEIRKSKLTNEKGLISTKEYKKGDVLRVLSGDIYNKPTRETINISMINLEYTLTIRLIPILMLMDVN